MSTSVELGNGTVPFICVSPRKDRLDFLGEFARHCFHVGAFRSKIGSRNKWLLDCRQGLGHGENAQLIASEMISLASEKQASQFVAAGFGGYLLVGAILATGGETIRGGLLRPSGKRYGRKRLVEGDLDPNLPVCLVDDILNSGGSAIAAVRALRREGFQKIEYVSIFYFKWGDGEQRLSAKSVDCNWLATVTRAQPLRDSTTERSSESRRGILHRLLCRMH